MIFVCRLPSVWISFKCLLYFYKNFVWILYEIWVLHALWIGFKWGLHEVCMKYWPLYELCIFGPIPTLYTTTLLLTTAAGLPGSEGKLGWPPHCLERGWKLKEKRIETKRQPGQLFGCCLVQLVPLSFRVLNPGLHPVWTFPFFYRIWPGNLT